jgi:predicted MFS family arabinose efflux permease
MPTPAQSLRAALIFATAIAVVNGFGRFAYALLLPVMREDLAWDYALSGWLNTANSLGYGLGALAGMFLLSRWRPATLFVAGLAVTVVTLLLCGVTRDLWTMMAWRFATGVGSAWVFACGGALIASHYNQNANQSAAAIAIYYAGGGLGIALSGILLYSVLGHDWSWSIGWLVLGLVGLVFSIWPAKLAVDIGGQTSSLASEKLRLADFTPILVAYFLFGVGYIVYMTFVMAWLREMHLGNAAATGVWLVLGMASMASGYVWRNIMARWWPAHTFAATCICTAVGTALPLLSSSLAMLLVSAILVGGSFFMTPGSMMALARRTLAPALWAKAMNLFTFIFAIGQGVGPVLAGWIADHHGLNTAMAAGAATLVAALLALVQKNKSLAL